MSIGNLQTEGDLANFIRQQINGSDLGVLIRQLQGRTYVAVAPSTLASPGNGNVTWTTLSVNGLLPATASAVVLSVSISGVVPGASYLQNAMDFRADPSSQTIATVAWKGATAGGGITTQIVVPLSGKSFQYQKTDAINSSSAGSIVLVGYMS